MTRIQQVLYELATPYMGHPYAVTSHAWLNALRPAVDAATWARLHASHGVFFPREYGRYPDAHSQPGYPGKVGDALLPVEAYADLFMLRDPAQRWLLDTRPRDAHNAHPIQRYGGRPAIAPRLWVGRRPAVANTRRQVPWRVMGYLHTGRGDDGILPLADETLDGLQVGGARNYGFGELALLDTQVIDLDALSYERVADAAMGAGLDLELISPYVLTSDYPGADDQSVPWWWDVPEHGLRRRRTRLAVGDDSYPVGTVDYGQVVGYAGDRPIETAKNGILRVGTHAKYGFGEVRLRPASADRVPNRGDAAAQAGGARR